MSNETAFDASHIAIEQAIARGWTRYRIIRELRVSEQQYEATSRYLDELVRGERTCDECGTSYPNLTRHVMYAHGDKRCGTHAGYRRHDRNGEPPCQPCKHARAQYDAHRRRQKRLRQLAASVTSETYRQRIPRTSET